MGVKRVLNIERIKDIVDVGELYLGEIMNSCQDLKYEILENIMKGVIYFFCRFPRNQNPEMKIF